MGKKQVKKRIKSIKDTNSDPRALYKWIGILLVVSFIVFSPALRNELVSWDDYSYIRDNPVVQNFSGENLKHIFDFNTFIMGNYHPLTILTYMIEYQVSGPSPFLYHLTNLLLHLCNIVLFSILIWLLTRRFYATLIAAALFAIHPMRVESVVWAAERKDVLYTLFYLFSVIAYIYYLTRSEKRSGNYAISLLFFLLALLSKGQAVVLPLTLFLIDFWYGKKIDWKSILNKIPFFALALIFGIIALQAQSSSLTEGRMLTYTFAERTLFAVYNLSAYLYKLIFPYNLATFYGYPAPNDMLMIYAGAVIALAILAYVFIRQRKNKVVMFGSLFFLFTVFIVIQLLPVGNAIIADRYTYIPYIGLFFILAMLLDPLLSSGSLRRRKAIGTLVLLQLVIFAGASFIQSRTWKNNETLWLRVIENDPEQGMAYNNLSIHYIDAEKYDTAFILLNQCLVSPKPYPEKYKAYQNLGKAYSETDQPLKAIKNFNQALTMSPRFMEAMFGKGLVYSDIGQYDSAIAIFTKILVDLNPKHHESYYSRAIACNKKGLTDRAIADYTSAIRVKPNYTSAFTNRGNIYFNLNQFDKAIQDYSVVLRLDPENGTTYRNRSFAYFRKGDYARALSDAEQARALNVTIHPEYLNDLRKQLSGKQQVKF